MCVCVCVFASVCVCVCVCVCKGDACTEDAQSVENVTSSFPRPCFCYMGKAQNSNQASAMRVSTLI